MLKNYLLFAAFSISSFIVVAQKILTTSLQVPAKNQYCIINEKGVSILPSGRFLTPAGSLVRITSHPFGMAISPDGKKAVTLHNGVFTIIDLASMQATRVPGYNQEISVPLAHEPLAGNSVSADTSITKIIKSPFTNGSFLGVAFAPDSKIVY